MQYSSWRIQVHPKRRSPRLLWVAVAVVAAGGVAAVAALSTGVWTPARQAAVQTPPVALGVASANPAPAAHPARAALPAWSPSTDTPAAPAAPAAPQAPKAAAATPPGPAILLVGTVVDRDPHYALLRTNDGNTRMAKVGDVIAGAQVTAVTRQDATVRFQGRSYTLTVAAQVAAAGPGGRTPGGDPGREAAVMAILDAQSARESAAASAAGSAGDSAAGLGQRPAAPAASGGAAPSAGSTFAQAQPPAAAGQADAAQVAPKFDRGYRQRAMSILPQIQAQVELNRRLGNVPLIDLPPRGNQ
jgi:hypothetical protein